MNRTEFVPQTKFSTAASGANQSAPAVGDCYRLKIIREASIKRYFVWIIASEGEWCIVLDLEPPYGQLNPAVGERLRWTNPHYQFQVVPIADWPSAARRCRPTGGFGSRTRTGGRFAHSCAIHSTASTRRQVHEEKACPCQHRAAVGQQRTTRRPRTSETATPGYETVMVQS